MSAVLKFCQYIFGHGAQCLYYVISLQLLWKIALGDLEDKRNDVAEWYEKDCLPYESKCRVSYGKCRTETCLKEIRHCSCFLYNLWLYIQKKQSNWCLGWKLWFLRLTFWLPASLWLISVPVLACLKARVGLKHPLTCNTQDSWILYIMSADILLDSECVVPGITFPWMQRNITVWQHHLGSLFHFINTYCLFLLDCYHTWLLEHSTKEVLRLCHPCEMKVL